MKRSTDTTRVDRQADAVHLGGQLNAVTVPKLLREIDGWLNAPTPTIDLAGVERSDSSGVALLVEIQRCARNTRRSVQFTNAPPQLRAMVAFCGLDQILAFE